MTEYQAFWTRVITEKVTIEAPDRATARKIAAELPLTHPRPHQDFSYVDEEFVTLKDWFEPVEHPREMELAGISLRQSSTWPDCALIVTDGERLLEPRDIVRMGAFLKSLLRLRSRGRSSV